MMTHITVLGSGTITSQANRSCAAYLIHEPEGPILMDCGPGSLLRLGEAGIAISDIRLVLLTHFHLDHVSDLAPLLNFHWLQKDRRKQRITIVGPAGLKQFFNWLSEQFGSWLQELEVDLVEMGSSETVCGPLRVETHLTGHTGNSICFRLTDEQGKVLFYSGDTGYNEGLIRPAVRADLAIFECSLPDSRPEQGHLTPSQAARLAAEARVNHLLLTHFYKEVLEEEFLNSLTRIFPGRISLAEDLEDYSLT